jgi:hypothetical protein
VVLGVYNEPNLAKPGGHSKMSVADYCALFVAADAGRGSDAMPLAGPETSWHGSEASDHYFDDSVNCLLLSMEPQDVFTLHYYTDASFTPEAQMLHASSLSEGHEVWASEIGIGDTPTDAEQEAFVIDYFDRFDDAAETNPQWTTSIFYRLYALRTATTINFRCSTAIKAKSLPSMPSRQSSRN